MQKDPKQQKILEEQMPYQYKFRNSDSNISQIYEDLATEDSGILNEDERKIQEDLKVTYQKNLETIEIFLGKEYASFQNKVFKCMYNRCFMDIFAQRQDIRLCSKQCSLGIQKVQEFTERQFKQAHDNFNECIQRSQKTGYALESAIKCHDKLIQGLENIKLNVRQEFNYYQ